MEGLNHTEIRHLAEKIGEQPEHQTETDKLAEFSVPSWLVSPDISRYVHRYVSRYVDISRYARQTRILDNTLE